MEERWGDMADGTKAPPRTPSSSTRLATSSTSAALAAPPTRTTSSGSPYDLTLPNHGPFANARQLTREEPQARCMECGSAYKMHYVGPAEDPHAHDHHDHPVNLHPKPKDMADFLKPEYLNA